MQQSQSIPATMCLPRVGLAGIYLAAVLCCRLIMRSSTEQLSEFAVASLEDSISILSFLMGLLYFWSSSGGPLADVAKRLSVEQGEGQRNVRLFYFAM
jgi:hypothetical protein